MDINGAVLHHLFQIDNMKFKDKRLKIMNEILNGIKVSGLTSLIHRVNSPNITVNQITPVPGWVEVCVYMCVHARICVFPQKKGFPALQEKQKFNSVVPSIILHPPPAAYWLWLHTVYRGLFCSPTLPFFVFHTTCCFLVLLAPLPLQILKLYAWEPSFQSKVEDIRGEELKVMKKFAYLTSVSTFVFSSAPALVSSDMSWSEEKIVTTWDKGHQTCLFNLFSHILLFPGLSCHLRHLCRGELREYVECWESFHCHLSFQHPSFSYGHVAHAHCFNGASRETVKH